jgi:hypothetical protein
MLDLPQLTTNLRFDMNELERLERVRMEVLNSQMTAAMKDERDRDFKEQIAKCNDRIARVLKEFADFPPCHARHMPFIDAFAKQGSYEKSVFIMTKFPDPKKPAVTDPQLKVVIEAVRAGVTAHGFVPRVASDQDYHPMLWDNVELYLLGSRLGIAIVEEKVLQELNPNVAMEWGWMRGLGRKVLYLVEKDFKSARADWSGLTESAFDWANPAPGIDDAVKKFLAAHA